MITSNLIGLRSHAGPTKSNHDEIPTSIPERPKESLYGETRDTVVCPSHVSFWVSLSPYIRNNSNTKNHRNDGKNGRVPARWD